MPVSTSYSTCSSPVPSSAADENHERRNRHAMNFVQPSLTRSFTLRSLVVGLVISVLVCLSNVYFGLQTGFYASMANASAAIGFAIIKLVRRPQSAPFSAQENVLIQTVAAASGCMPAAAGLLAAIPALEFLIGPGDGGPVKLTYTNAVLWSIGVGFIGLIFAMALREHLVVRTNLPYPGPLATASLIETLHLKTSTQNPSRHAPHEGPDLEAVSSEDVAAILSNENPNFVPDNTYRQQMQALSGAAITSGILTLLRYFVPILRSIPLFGRNAKVNWLWYLDLSPGFVGTGIITGPVVPFHMLCGAVVGWGILSPIAHRQKWVTGDVGDWEKGARGWISWIGLAALLADCIVKMIWPSIVVVVHFLSRSMQLSNYSLLDVDENDDRSSRSSTISPESHTVAKTTMRPASSIINKVSVTSVAAASLLCVLTTKVAFKFMPAHIVGVAIIISLPLSIMGIQAVGETDFNPVAGIGKVSQLVFAIIVPRSHPSALLINLVAGSIAEAGATQAGDISYDLRVGHLLGADLHAQLYGQLIGCVFGAFVSCGLYKLYTSAYIVPGSLFQVPVAYMAVIAARLVSGKGLPPHVPDFALGFGIFFTCASIIRIRYSDRKWHVLIPSGTSFAVGIITSPSFSLARMIGGLLYWYSTSYGRRDKDFMILLASGLVLGEGLMSLVTLMLEGMVSQ